jgi:hypothetical protein
MKNVGVLAAGLGALGMMAGVLGASVPFSIPWADIGAGFMAFAFVVSVSTIVVSMNVLRAGLDVARDREGGVAHLARTLRSLALLSLAIGVVVAIRAGQGGAGPAVAAIGVAAIAALGTMAAARALTRSSRGDAE